jgi:hypothetical protein
MGFDTLVLSVWILSVGVIGNALDSADGNSAVAEQPLVKKLGFSKRPGPKVSTHPYHEEHRRRYPPQNNAADAVQFDAPSDNLTTVQTVYYYGEVILGTQVFQAIYDTGSSNLWMPGAACSSTDCNGKTKYTGPSTALNEPFSITYGSGDVSGQLYNVPISLAGCNISAYTVGLASDINFPGYASAPYEGILGLAWPGLTGTDNIPAIIPELYKAGQIAAPLFGLFLSTDLSGGELTLGEADPDHYQGNFTWVTLTEQLWWTVGMWTVAVNNNVVLSANPSSSGGGLQTSNSCIIDSGTSLIIGPQESIATLVQAIANAANTQLFYSQSGGYYYVDPNAANSLPPISFTLQGGNGVKTTFTMTGLTYVLPELAISSNQLPLAFQGMGTNTDMWIMGDPFLRVFYSVYDYGNSRVGFAPAYPSTGSVTPGSAMGLNHHSVLVIATVVSLLATLTATL